MKWTKGYGNINGIIYTRCKKLCSPSCTPWKTGLQYQCQNVLQRNAAVHDANLINFPINISYSGAGHPVMGTEGIFAWIRNSMKGETPMWAQQYAVNIKTGNRKYQTQWKSRRNSNGKTHVHRRQVQAEVAHETKHSPWAWKTVINVIFLCGQK